MSLIIKKGKNTYAKAYQLVWHYNTFLLRFFNILETMSAEKLEKAGIIKSCEEDYISYSITGLPGTIRLLKDKAHNCIYIDEEPAPRTNNNITAEEANTFIRGQKATFSFNNRGKVGEALYLQGYTSLKRLRFIEDKETGAATIASRNKGDSRKSPLDKRIERTLVRVGILPKYYTVTNYPSLNEAYEGSIDIINETKKSLNEKLKDIFPIDDYFYQDLIWILEYYLGKHRNEDNRSIQERIQNRSSNKVNIIIDGKEIEISYFEYMLNCAVTNIFNRANVKGDRTLNNIKYYPNEVIDEIAAISTMLPIETKKPLVK